MTDRPTGGRLIVLASVGWLWGCGPRAVNEPPPQTPASATTPADAGLPAPPPLARKGVIVPSDVKLQSAPSEAAPAGAPSGPSPGGN